VAKYFSWMPEGFPSHGVPKWKVVGKYWEGTKDGLHARAMWSIKKHDLNEK
jgi:hypothetical protein